MKALAVALSAVLSMGPAHTTTGTHPQPYVKPTITVTYVPTSTYHLQWKGYGPDEWFIVERRDPMGSDWRVTDHDSLTDVRDQFYVTLTDGQTAKVLTVGPQGVQEVDIP